ncbi:hypothetical protein HZS_1002, partial [Henneguya salminicola]
MNKKIYAIFLNLNQKLKENPGFKSMQENLEKIFPDFWSSSPEPCKIDAYFETIFLQFKKLRTACGCSSGPPCNSAIYRPETNNAICHLYTSSLRFPDSVLLRFYYGRYHIIPMSHTYIVVFSLSRKTKRYNKLNSAYLHKKLLLLKILIHCLDNNNDPAVYFHFEGKPGSGIFIPSISYIERSNEYSFTSWFNIRDSGLLLKGTCSADSGHSINFWTPYLFHFCTDHIQSIAVYFTVNKLCFDLIDFSNITTKFSRCFIGKSSFNDPYKQFIGSISSFHTWKKCLSHELIRKLYKLSPRYQGLFLEKLNLNPDNIMCAINPIYAKSNICYNMTTYPTTLANSCHAVYSNEIWLVRTTNIQTKLSAFGGIDILMALFNRAILYLLIMLYDENNYTQNTINISKVKNINIHQVPIIPVIIISMQISSIKQENDDLYEIALDFVIKLKNIVESSSKSISKIYSKVGWQGWFVTLLHIFKKHEKFKDIYDSVLSIILCVIKTGFINFVDGWITFIDLLGYFHYITSYKNFDLIDKLFDTEFKRSNAIINKFIPSASECKGNEFMLLKHKHQMGININRFNYHPNFIQNMFYVLKCLKLEYSNFESNNINYHLPFLVFIKNITNVILFMSDFVINIFGGISNLMNLAVLPDSSKNHSFSFLNISNYPFAYKILKILCFFIEQIFINNRVLFKKMEDTLDLEPAELLKISLRLFLSKFLLEICMKNCSYWNFISQHNNDIETPLNQLQGEFINFLLKESKLLQFSTEVLSHPLEQTLLSQTDFRVMKEIMNRKDEYIKERYPAIDIGMYILRMIMLSHYKRILLYQPFENDIADSKKEISYFVQSSLNGIAVLLYQTLVSHNNYFNVKLLDSLGKSILDVGLKSMKSPFQSLEFVMLLSSQTWESIFENMFYKTFIAFSNDSIEFSNQTLDQIEKRSCLAADHILYSTLYVSYSYYRGESYWKDFRNTYTALKFSNKFFNISKIDSNAQLLFQDATKTSTHITKALLFDKIFTNIPAEKYLKLQDQEDAFRRRYRLKECNLNPIVACQVISLGSQKKTAGKKSKLTKNDKLNELSIAFTQWKSLQEILSLKSDESKTGHNVLYNSPNSESSYRSVTKNSSDGEKHENLVFFPAKLITPATLISGHLCITNNQCFKFIVDFEALSEFISLFDFDELEFMDCEVVRVFVRYYRQKLNSLEIFITSRKSYYFSMDNYESVKSVINILPKVGVGNDYGLPIEREVSFYSAKTLFELSDVPKKWSKGFISNFEYLMFINTIAGRTYQDISQYPIFPWILSNYESDTLDLNDENNYRDLSKPVNYLSPKTPDRNFIKNYEIETSLEIPLSSHRKYYSTPDCVTDYLLRLEPFSSIRSLMCPDSMGNPLEIFKSISLTWEKITTFPENAKELIPEFFYLPEMFDSKKSLILQDNKTLIIPNVELPPYTQRSIDFIRINSNALESSIVSRNLHKWIDLVFGFSQRGESSMESISRVPFLTYESLNDQQKADIESTEEPLSKYFNMGVLPQQITHDPHREKMMKFEIFNSLKKNGRFINIKKKIKCNNIVGIVSIFDSSPIIYVGFSSNNGHIKICVIDSFLKYATFKIEKNFSLDNVIKNIKENKIRSFLLEFNLGWNSTTFINSFFLSPSGNYIISAYPFIDSSLKLFDVSSGFCIQEFEQFHDHITCIDGDYNSLSSQCFIGIGFDSGTICICNYISFIDRISRNRNLKKVSKLLPLCLMYGHTGPISHINIRKDLELILTASSSGHCCIHSFEKKLLTRFKITDKIMSEIINIQLTNDGFALILFHADNESIFSLHNRNGLFIIEKRFSQLFSIMIFDWFKKYCIVCDKNNTIFILDTFNFEIIHSYLPTIHKITCIKVINSDNLILVGFETGEI